MYPVQRTSSAQASLDIAPADCGPKRPCEGMQIVPDSVHRGGLTFAEIANVKSDRFSADGQKIGEANLLSEHRPEDVLGALVFSVPDGVGHIWINLQRRPALLAREIFGLPPLPSVQNGLMVNEIGGYSSGDGLDDAVRSVLSDKAPHLKPVRFERIGGTILPNASVSPELEIPVMGELPSDFPLESVSIPGEGFDAERVVFPERFDSVVAKTFAGEYGDPRLFENVCRISGRLEREGRISEGLRAPEPLIERVAADLNKLSNGAKTDVPTSSIARIKALLLNPSAESNLPAWVKVKVLPGEQVNSPYELLHFDVTSSGDNAASDRFGVDAVVRQSDRVNATVLTLSKGEPVMLVNIGVRDILGARDHYPKLTQVRTEARSVEGLSADIEGNERDSKSLTKSAARELKKRTGLNLNSEVTLSGIHGVLSPGVNTTAFWHCFAYVEPAQAAGTPLPPAWHWMKPYDVLSLAQQGVIRDQQLITAARAFTLTQAQPTDSQALAEFGSAALQRLNDRAMRVSPQLHFVRECSPEMRALIARPIFNNLIMTRINKSAIRIEEPEAGSPEAFFFNSLMPGFVIHRGDHPLRILKLFIHDSGHDSDRSPLPFEIKDGRLVPCAFERYLAAEISREVNQVVTSELFLPTYYGVANFESQLGSRTLASLFHRAGIVFMDEQVEAVGLAIRHGELDDRLVDFLKDPSVWQEYEDVVREMLLGYYVRDTLTNVPLLYDYWISRSEVADTLQRMRVRLIDQAEKDNAPLEIKLQRMVQSREGQYELTGYNPLQEALAYTAIYEIYEPAARLSGMAHLIRENAADKASPAVTEALAEIRPIKEELIACFNDLSSLVDQIDSIEPTLENISAEEMLTKCQADLVKRAQALIEKLSASTELFTDEQRKMLGTRRHFPFPVIPFDPRQNAEAQRTVTELARASFARRGRATPF